MQRRQFWSLSTRQLNRLSEAALTTQHGMNGIDQFLASAIFAHDLNRASAVQYGEWCPQPVAEILGALNRDDEPRQFCNHLQAFLEGFIATRPAIQTGWMSVDNLCELTNGQTHDVGEMAGIQRNLGFGQERGASMMDVHTAQSSSVQLL